MTAITTRSATAADTAEALAVVRESITQSCVADHQYDPPTLERWLRNKTPEHFARWCSDPDTLIVVAELDGAIAGVAALHRSGQIHLFYVRPAHVRLGVGRALLLAIEAQALALHITTLTLESTLCARRFYRQNGFEAAGDPTPQFGVLRGYPHRKVLAR